MNRCSLPPSAHNPYGYGKVKGGKTIPAAGNSSRKSPVHDSKIPTKEEFDVFIKLISATTGWRINPRKINLSDPMHQLILCSMFCCLISESDAKPAKKNDNTKGTAHGARGSGTVSNMPSPPTPVLTMKEALASVDSRLVIDAGLTREDCANIREAYEAALNAPRYSQFEILQSLAPASSLRIRCVNEKYGGTMAVFDWAENVIELPPGVPIGSSALRHESTHFLNTALHSTAQCMESGINKGSPVYPYTEEENREFLETFETGFNRIREFKDYIDRIAKGLPLTPDEKDAYHQYRAAIEDCLPAECHFRVPKELDDKMVGLEFGYGQLTQVYKIDQKPFGIFECTTPEKFINVLLIDLKTLKKQHYSGAEESAETEAWALQRLSIFAQGVFYPEAIAKRDEYRARCVEEISGIPVCEMGI